MNPGQCTQANLRDDVGATRPAEFSPVAGFGCRDEFLHQGRKFIDGQGRAARGETGAEFGGLWAVALDEAKKSGSAAVSYLRLTKVINV